MSMSGLIPLGRLPRIRGAATSPSDEAEIPPLPPRDDAARRRRSRSAERGEEEALFSSEEVSCSSEDSAPKIPYEAEERQRSYESTGRPSSRRSQRASAPRYRSGATSMGDLSGASRGRRGSAAAKSSRSPSPSSECTSGDEAAAPSRESRGKSPTPDARAERMRRRGAADWRTADDIIVWLDMVSIFYFNCITEFFTNLIGVVNEYIQIYDVQFASETCSSPSPQEAERSQSALAPIFGAARVTTSTAPRRQTALGAGAQRRRAERDVLFPSSRLRA